MIPKLGAYRLLFDLAKVPLIDPATLKSKVSNDLLNNPEYLAMTLITEGVFNIKVEDLIIGKILYKRTYNRSKQEFLGRSEDMKELIDEQRKERNNFFKEWK